LVVKVSSNVAGGSTLSNTASGSSTTTDPNPANNTATASTGVVASADLVVTKSDTPAPVTAGNHLTYSPSITNGRPADPPTAPTPANNTTTASTGVVATAELVVTKSGPAAAIADTNLSYSITIGNGGPSDAQTVNLSDPLPLGTTFVSLVQNTGPTFTCTT